MSDDEEDYEILDLPPSASLEDVTSAFREKIKDNHPDIGGDVETAKRLIAAYRRIIARKSSEALSSSQNPFDNIKLFFEAVSVRYKAEKGGLFVNEDELTAKYVTDLSSCLDRLEVLTDDVVSEDDRAEYKSLYESILRTYDIVSGEVIDYNTATEQLRKLRNPFGVQRSGVEVDSGDWSVEGRQAIVDLLKKLQKIATAQQQKYRKQLEQSEEQFVQEFELYEQLERLASGEAEGNEKQDQEITPLSELKFIRYEVQQNLMREYINHAQQVIEFVEQEMESAQSDVKKAQAAIENRRDKINFMDVRDEFLSRLAVVVEQATSARKDVIQAVNKWLKRRYVNREQSIPTGKTEIEADKILQVQLSADENYDVIVKLFGSSSYPRVIVKLKRGEEDICVETLTMVPTYNVLEQLQAGGRYHKESSSLNELVMNIRGQSNCISR